MAAHIEHPKSHEHGLCDDCPECVSRIEQPLLLDDENLRRIWSGDHRSRTDVKVYDVLYRGAVQSQRILSAFGVGVGDRRGPFEFGGKA